MFIVVFIAESRRVCLERQHHHPGDRARAQERAQLLQEVPGVPLQAEVRRGHPGPVPGARAQAQVQAGELLLLLLLPLRVLASVRVLRTYVLLCVCLPSASTKQISTV